MYLKILMSLILFFLSISAKTNGDTGYQRALDFLDKIDVKIKDHIDIYNKIDDKEREKKRTEIFKELDDNKELLDTFYAKDQGQNIKLNFDKTMAFLNGINTCLDSMEGKGNRSMLYYNQNPAMAKASYFSLYWLPCPEVEPEKLLPMSGEEIISFFKKSITVAKDQYYTDHLLVRNIINRFNSHLFVKLLLKLDKRSIEAEKIHFINRICKNICHDGIWERLQYDMSLISSDLEYNTTEGFIPDAYNARFDIINEYLVTIDPQDQEAQFDAYSIIRAVFGAYNHLDDPAGESLLQLLDTPTMKKEVGDIDQIVKQGARGKKVIKKLMPLSHTYSCPTGKKRRRNILKKGLKPPNKNCKLVDSIQAKIERAYKELGDEFIKSSREQVQKRDSISLFLHDPSSFGEIAQSDKDVCGYYAKLANKLQNLSKLEKATDYVSSGIDLVSLGAVATGVGSGVGAVGLTVATGLRHFGTKLAKQSLLKTAKNSLMVAGAAQGVNSAVKSTHGGMVLHLMPSELSGNISHSLFTTESFKRELRGNIITELISSASLPIKVSTGLLGLKSLIKTLSAKEIKTLLKVSGDLDIEDTLEVLSLVKTAKKSIGNEAASVVLAQWLEQMAICLVD